MGSANCFDGVDQYDARIVRYWARRLVGQVGFTKSDCEDLEQDLLVDLYRRLADYDPTRARRSTFVARVVRNRALDIIAARKAACRDYRLCTCSLNEVLEDDEGSAIERSGAFDLENYLHRTGRLSHPMEEQRDLRLDIHGAMERLPSALLQLCRLLQTNTITEVSHATGIPRGTIYEHIRKLRAIFEDTGLREYL